VLNPSAVKCVHAYDVCGYCDLCGGYFHPDAPELDTGAENQLCPVGAIKRTYVEDPFYQYTIDESLCIGCGKCVKGCAAFGNGSLFLQVRHDRCLNCNECSIARACPADAFRRVPAGSPYLLKGRSGKERDR
jgi:electron transport complex protein RnfB